jgi:quercetin dioxygenase-like cupin family protein
MSSDDAVQFDTITTNDVWNNLEPVEASPGFSLRTTFPTNPDGVEVMLERWEAGTEEPPHTHPGDDMTVVIEGRMSTQCYRQEGGRLIAEGERVYLNKGDVGYGRAGRIHDAKYIEECQLVFVHNGAFGFHLASVEVG